MGDIKLVRKDEHADRTWARPSNYAFASRHAVVPLAAAEVARAALAMPIALVANGETLSAVAVLGFRPDQNLFVAPDGRWAGAYIPAAFRSYPFVLAKSGEDQLSLCVDESSVIDSGQGGEQFFDGEGKPAKAVADMLDFLVKTHQSREAANRATAALQAYGLLEPWPVKVKDGEQEQDVDGLLRVNEKALDALDGEALLALRNAGALPLAYAQLLSMQNLQLLSTLWRAQIAAQNRPSQSSQHKPYFIDTGKEETFNWSAILGDEGKSKE